MGADPLERFWTNVDRSDPTGCWPWTGRLDRDGYPVFRVRGPDGVWRNVRANRWLYEQVNGALGDDHTLDHECHTYDLTCPGGPCRHRACVRPGDGHNVPVTAQENRARVDWRREAIRAAE